MGATIWIDDGVEEAYEARIGYDGQLWKWDGGQRTVVTSDRSCDYVRKYGRGPNVERIAVLLANYPDSYQGIPRRRR